MLIEDAICVGKVQRAHGLRGELCVLLFAGRADWLEAFKKVYLVPRPPEDEISRDEILAAGKARRRSAGNALTQEGATMLEAKRSSEKSHLQAGGALAPPSHSDLFHHHKDPKQLCEFELRDFKVYKQGLLIKIEGVKDRTQAENLKGSLFYIPKSWLVAEPGEEMFCHEFLGFELWHLEKGLVGTICDFSSNGAQDLLVVTEKNDVRGDRRVEVPLVEAWVVGKDMEARTLTMNFPWGLVEEEEGE